MKGEIGHDRWSVTYRDAALCRQHTVNGRGAFIVSQIEITFRGKGTWLVERVALHHLIPPSA